MRPNNPNKRLRGRNRPKSANPLARSYESNGPDVRIRGSALQVADKYAQLARDAQSSGDRVMAENYFQHAEHYYRIVAAAYEQQNQQRRDEGDRPVRDERPSFRGGEQPAINGFDEFGDDDEGVRRALRVNGGSQSNGRARDEEATEERPAGAQPATEQPHDGEPEATPAAAEATEPAGETEEAPKPRRRARTLRRTRTRRTDGETAAPEATEQG